MSARARSSLKRMVMAMPPTNPNYNPPDPNRFIRMLERETSPESAASSETIASREPQSKPKPPMSLDQTRAFLEILQRRAEQTGCKHPLTMAEFFQELMKLPRTEYDPSNNCFTTLDAAAKSDPWNWYKLPAIQYLDAELLEITSRVRRNSTISAVAINFVPAGMHVVHNEYLDHYSQAVLSYDEQMQAAQHQAYLAAQDHTPITPPTQQSTQLVQYRPFQRSNMRQDMDRVEPAKATTSQAENDDTRVDLRTNYKGEETNLQKRNADCTEEQNVAIRMNHLPSDVAIAEVLGTISEGKVFSSSLVSAKPPLYPHAAANITFLTLEAANAFYDRGVNEGIWIRGHRAHILRNRHKVKYFDRRDELEQSRVLQIFGPAAVFSVGEVLHFLHWFVHFVEVVPPQLSFAGPSVVMLEVVFQSIYGQSRQAKKGFEDLWMSGQFNGYGKLYQVGYGLDPCDAAARFSSGG